MGKRQTLEVISGEVMNIQCSYTPHLFTKHLQKGMEQCYLSSNIMKYHALLSPIDIQLSNSLEGGGCFDVLNDIHSSLFEYQVMLSYHKTSHKRLLQLISSKHVVPQMVGSRRTSNYGCHKIGKCMTQVDLTVFCTCKKKVSQGTFQFFGLNWNVHIYCHQYICCGDGGSTTGCSVCLK